MEHKDSVVLVDKYGRDLLNKDGDLSIMEKMEAHRHGLLHRAISVFVFNDKNELLLQRRAAGKYHSPDKWTNTCCTHPLPGETPFGAAQRRLNQEIGIFTPLIEVFTFSYRADVGSGLIENEYDHVFFGVSNQNPNPNHAEVSDWKWVTIENLEQELIRNPKDYSPWLRRCFSEIVNHRSRKLKCDNI
jgi:isopentenyl-diphosphate delta-isomerase